MKMEINKFKKFVLTPFFLLLLCFLNIAYILNSDINITIFSYIHDNVNGQISQNQELIKGQPIRISFTAVEDYLGIISIHFDKENLVNDMLLIRIKEVGEKDWYYKAEFPTQQFYHLPTYSFGIPVIIDSKGKTFIVELSTENGEKGKSLKISPQNSLVTKYQIPKNTLIGDKNLLIRFFNYKYIYALRTSQIIIAYLLLLLPLASYVMEKLLNRSKNTLLKGLSSILVYVNNKFFLIILSLIWCEVFFFKFYNEKVAILFLIFYSLLLLRCKLRNTHTILLIILLLALSILFYIINEILLAERLAIWLYIVLLIFAGQLLIENNKTQLYLLGKNHYIKPYLTIFKIIGKKKKSMYGLRNLLYGKKKKY